MIGLTRANSMAAVMLAATRAAERGDEQHGRGLTLLATISATAPFVGVFGTLYWFLTLFRGWSGEKYAIYRYLELGISHSLWFTAAGLLIAVMSYAGYRFGHAAGSRQRGLYAAQDLIEERDARCSA